MTTPDTLPLIGGPYCAEGLDPTLLQAPPAPLTAECRDELWKLFSAIDAHWRPARARDNSPGMRSSWLEFVTLRAEKAPSYVAEYENAANVLAELSGMYGKNAYAKLFFEIGPVKENPRTRLEHCKCYVVNEFIKVYIVASGFRRFGGKNRAMNYNGFIRGTRYNRIDQVREFEPPKQPRRKS